MDLAPTQNPTNPIVPIQKLSTSFDFPMFDIDQLTSSQKSLLDTIFKNIDMKVAPRLTAAKWKREKEDNSPLTDFLVNILTIVKEHMPALAIDIGKYNDIRLQEKIDRLLKEIDTITSIFQDWQEAIDKDIVVFKVTLPQTQEYKDRLEHHAENHAILIDGDYQMLLLNENDLSVEIQGRIQAYKFRKTTQKSYDLIANSHDSELSYIKNNIENYKSRTEEFEKQKETLTKKINELKTARTNFEYAFCYLTYVISNNVIADDSTKLFFDPGWKLGYYFMPKITPKKSISVLNMPINSQIPSTEKKINEYSLIILKMLSKKFAILTGQEDLFTCPPCENNIFALRLGLVHAWTPLKNHMKMAEDDRLTEEIESLFQTIGRTATTFDGWKEMWQTQLELLIPGKNQKEQSLLNSKLGVLEEGNASLDKNASRLFEMLEDEKQFTVWRKRDMTRYREISAKELLEITTSLVDLKRKIKERILAGAKRDTVHDTSLEIICNANDITIDTLKENIKNYQQNTINFEAYLKKVQEEITKMNTNIDNFCYAFNYFSYLYEKGYENTTKNSFWFDLAHRAGYYNYIQEGKFKEPPANTTQEQLQIESTPEQRATYSVDTSVLNPDVLITFVPENTRSLIIADEDSD